MHVQMFMRCFYSLVEVSLPACLYTLDWFDQLLYVGDMLGTHRRIKDRNIPNRDVDALSFHCTNGI